MKFLEKGEFSRVAHQKHMFHRLPHHHCHNKDRKCSRTQNLCNKSETLWRIDQRALLDQVQVLYMLRQARARLERCAETLGRHTVETGGKNHFGIHSFAHQLRLEGFRRNLPKQLCQSSVRYSACHCSCMVQRKLSRRNPACIFGAIRNAAFYEHRSLCSCSSPAPAPGISQNNQAGMLPSAPVINPPPHPLRGDADHWKILVKNQLVKPAGLNQVGLPQGARRRLQGLMAIGAHCPRRCL